MCLHLCLYAFVSLFYVVALLQTYCFFFFPFRNALVSVKSKERTKSCKIYNLVVHLSPVKISFYEFRKGSVSQITSISISYCPDLF